MAKNRTVFLFGSGVTLAWGSPTTCDLTRLIRDTGFETTDGTKITEFIYKRLRDNKYPCNEVNFETIISVIDELVVYYSQFNADTKTPSLMSSFLASCFQEELCNYSIKAGGPAKHGYQLQIPAGVDYDLSEHAYHNETPPQFFFQQLLSTLLHHITAEIHKYAFHTPATSMKGLDSETSALFVDWMKLLSRGNSTLRLYTLNYERIFKILLARAGMCVFEGFDCGEYIDPDLPPLRVNVRKILSDTDSHIHYNLHGSAFWQVLPLDKEQLPNPEIVLDPIFCTPLANSPASVQIEKGKTLLVTSIVTGYQKAQRSMITPFKQMQAAFDRDCCFADEIYVSGYSFGDEHINESMKTAIRHNKKLKIIIVDPRKEMKSQVDRQWFPFSATVHPMEFNEFLRSQLIAGSD